MGAGAVHVFEDEVVFAGLLVLAVVEGADDVGVVEEFAALGLAVEAVDVALAAGELVVEHLDGDLAVFALFPAEVDRAHAALAEPPQKAVFAEAAQVVQRVVRPAGRAGRVQVGVFHALSRRAIPFFGGAPICSVQTGGRSAGSGGWPGRIRVNLPRSGVLGNKEMRRRPFFRRQNSGIFPHFTRGKSRSKAVRISPGPRTTRQPTV